jgi:two-component system, NarL family, nitrate/nitrite response regulator NarL
MVMVTQHDRDPRRIVVAERSSMQCELLARALGAEREFEIVGTASDSKRTLRLLQQLEPAIAVVSADLQDGPNAGLEVIARVRTRHCHTRTVVLLDQSDRELVVRAFRSGARGVFFRAQPYAMFPRCLRTIHQGQVWVSTKEMNFLLEALADPLSVPLVDNHGTAVLTPQESKVVQLATEGLSNREIANKLGLSEHTVKNYMFRIFEKTGVCNRVALVLYMMSRRDQWQTEENGTRE